jgi:hypothetical protein
LKQKVSGHRGPVVLGGTSQRLVVIRHEIGETVGCGDHQGRISKLLDP